MGKIQVLLAENATVGFLIVTFAISMIAFVLMVNIPGAHTPESSNGLPVWLIAIWSPNIAAILIWASKKELVSNLRLAFAMPSFSWWLLLALVPLVVTGIMLIKGMANENGMEWSKAKAGYLLPLIFVNLIMGPLGEELGWRAFLYPLIRDRYGWMASALIVGVIWALWHAPLWFIGSPQAKIPFWAFFTNVLLLSILMSMIYDHAQGSILFVILLHLNFNLGIAVAELVGSHAPGEFIRNSLYIYVPVVLFFVGIHELTSVKTCLIK